MDASVASVIISTQKITNQPIQFVLKEAGPGPVQVPQKTAEPRKGAEWSQALKCLLDLFKLMFVKFCTIPIRIQTHPYRIDGRFIPSPGHWIGSGKSHV